MQMLYHEKLAAKSAQTPSGSVKATVLVGKLKMRIFKQPVHEDDEFAHAGGQGDFRFFACGSQAKVELLENAVVADGADGGHVKDPAHRFAASGNMTGAGSNQCGWSYCQMQYMQLFYNESLAA
jgi:hypothetical protein